MDSLSSCSADKDCSDQVLIRKDALKAAVLAFGSLSACHCCAGSLRILPFTLTSQFRKLYGAKNKLALLGYSPLPKLCLSGLFCLPVKI